MQVRLARLLPDFQVIDRMKQIQWHRTGQTDGLQDMSSSQLFAWFDRLCQGLRQTKEGEVRRRVQGFDFFILPILILIF